MKTYKILAIALIGLSISLTSFSQKEKNETIKVSGNCGMCKKKIETAAKNAGASYALWNVKTKELTVKYNSKSTNNAKIQEAVAKSGYDTEKVKATDEAYNNLHSCCKYDRSVLDAKANCCEKGSCDMQECNDAGCCKDGKCDMNLCPHKNSDNVKDCCKKETEIKGKKQ